jgi:primosomal protein N' (replication factor Y)
VTLVGVLMAELGLRIPDFRASERTFQLMTQIAGRAGRAEQPGRMLLQTLVPEHYAIQHAVNHDAERFLEEEAQLRKALSFPPFGPLALFRLSGTDPERVQREATRIATWLARLAEPNITVQGPMPAPIERVRGKWRFQVMARAPGRHALGVTLNRLMDALDAEKPASGVQLSLDVDPYTFL